MSLSQSHLAAVQQAGQALHHATQLISESVRTQAQDIVALVASQPFQTESEHAFGQFRMLARLSQDLQAMEVQLRDLYATAAALANPALDVIADQQRLPIHATTNASAVDAVIKPAAARSKPYKAAQKTSDRAPHTSNDVKVHQFLKSALNTNAWTALTGAAIARGAGLPPGSVSVSLNKVLASGAVIKGKRGMYRLARR